jgi:hypothetical protein
MKKSTKSTKPVKKTTKPAVKKSTKPAKKTTAKKTSKPVKPVKVVDPKSLKHVSATINTAPLVSKKDKYLKPAIVQTPMGLGLIYSNEPTVLVKHGLIPIAKTIVHLVKDNMEPGKPKKILVTMDKVTILTPAHEDKPVRVEREKGERGESAKDFSKYKFQGNLLSKGRLVHAVIAKFATDNNPTLLELNTAFPAEVIRPYGKGLFLPLEEAEKINTDSKRTRFFTKPEDIIKIKGVKIAVSNQIDGELVKRMLTVTPKHNYKIALVASEHASITANVSEQAAQTAIIADANQTQASV